MNSRSKLPDHALITFKLSTTCIIPNKSSTREDFDIDNVVLRKYDYGNMRADFGKSEICRQAVIELIQQIECNREDQEILDRVYDQFTNIITEEMNRNIPFKDIDTSSKRKKKRAILNHSGTMI